MRGTFFEVQPVLLVLLVNHSPSNPTLYTISKTYNVLIFSTFAIYIHINIMDFE